MTAPLPPFRCWLVRDCADRPGTVTTDRDPDGRAYAELGDAVAQAEALAALNTGARIDVHDGLGATVASRQAWAKTEAGYRLLGAEIVRAGSRWVLRFAGVEIKLPRRATFDHAEAELRRRGVAC